MTGPGGTDDSPNWFFVTAGGPPVVTSFSPANGPVGSTVSVFGSGFTGATAVVFGLYTTGGQPAVSFSAISDSEISVTVPAGAVDGHIQVTGPGGTDDSPNWFFVTASGAPPPSTAGKKTRKTRSQQPARVR